MIAPVDPAPVDSARARIRVRVGAVVVLLLVGLGCAVLVSVFANPATTTAVTRQEPAASEVPEGVDSGGIEIFVHVLGAVAHPGLYGLREGDRAVDAIAAAGGYADDADRSFVNLARFVVDGEQIRVPVVGEVPVAAPGMTAQGLVNLNTADATTLETLPRVGPALAARIIDWREANGRFSSIDDLLNVSGIGSKTFDGLKDLVTV